MNDRLRAKIPFIVQPGERVEEAVAKALVDHQNEFTPLFERMIDIEDARVSVTQGCLDVESIEVGVASGVAEIQFMSSFYAGCKDMDSDGWHEAALRFEIENGYMIFDIELPRIWRVDQ